jgi:hypothetical protein
MKQKQIVLTNTFILIIYILLLALSCSSILPIRYRLLVCDYYFVFIIFLIGTLIISLIKALKEKKYWLLSLYSVAVIIFMIMTVQYINPY